MMPICIQRNADGTYRLHHRPVEAGKERYKWIDGPVFRTLTGTRRLYYLQFGLGDGPWLIMWRDYLTGKACRMAKSGSWTDRADAETELRRLADERGWRDAGAMATPDFVD
jgi:hypothetical protein